MAKKSSEILRRIDRPKKGLTRPMPEAAQRVAKILRRDVQQPSELPIGCPLRFDMVYIAGRDGWACPMGLHNDSHGRDEPCVIPFGEDGESFSAWWDEQEDAEAAVATIWSER